MFLLMEFTSTEISKSKVRLKQTSGAAKPICPGKSLNKNVLVDVNSKFSGGEQESNRKAESVKENLTINDNGRLGLVDKQIIKATVRNSKQIHENQINPVEDCETPVLRSAQSENVAKTSNNNKEVVPGLIKDWDSWDTNQNTAFTKHQNDRKGSKRPSIRKSLFSK